MSKQFKQNKKMQGKVRNDERKEKLREAGSKVREPLSTLSRRCWLRRTWRMRVQGGMAVSDNTGSSPAPYMP